MQERMKLAFRRSDPAATLDNPDMDWAIPADTM